MGFFKTKKDVVEFSRNFYDTYLFGPKIAGVDPVSAYAETVHRSISKNDAMFSAVQLPKLKDELLGIQLEMIGTAWTHQSKEAAAIANSEFTKKYLADKGRSDLWEIMGEYNQRVAASATYGADSATVMGRARIKFINNMRTQIFDLWHANGIYDLESMARVVNRLGSEKAWNNGMTPALVGIKAIRRLDIKFTELIARSLAAVAVGFHQGAREALGGVKLAA